LEPRRAAADQRQSRREARHRGKPIEEIILGPKDDRRTDDDSARKSGARPRFALGLALGIVAGAVGIGTDRRHLEELFCSAVTRRIGGCFGTEGMDGIEALRSRRIENAGEIYDHRCAVADSAQ
jgi:hypothetical protein